MEKALKKLEDKGDCIDIDKILDFFMEEYFEAKKRINKILVKNFSKAFDQEHGVFTIDDMRKITKDIINAKSALEGYQFPKGNTNIIQYF